MTNNLFKVLNLYGENMVIWKSKKYLQDKSNCEVKYRAMAKTTCEIMKIQNLL